MMVQICDRHENCEHAPRHCADTALWTVAVLVGGSRLQLGVHWPTDVVGAALATDLWWSLTSSDPRRWLPPA